MKYSTGRRKLLLTNRTRVYLVSAAIIAHARYDRTKVLTPVSFMSFVCKYNLTEDRRNAKHKNRSEKNRWQHVGEIEDGLTKSLVYENIRIHFVLR